MPARPGLALAQGQEHDEGGDLGELDGRAESVAGDAPEPQPAPGSAEDGDRGGDPGEHDAVPAEDEDRDQQRNQARGG